jgi:hypothetical protein
MGEAIGPRAGQPFHAEHARPIFKGQDATRRPKPVCRVFAASPRGDALPDLKGPLTVAVHALSRNGVQRSHSQYPVAKHDDLNGDRRSLLQHAIRSRSRARRCRHCAIDLEHLSAVRAPCQPRRGMRRDPLGYSPPSETRRTPGPVFRHSEGQAARVLLAAQQTHRPWGVWPERNRAKFLTQD